MLGREIETSNSENSGLQSGFDTKKVGGVKTVRSQFKEALTLNQLQVTEAQVTKAALANGQAKGQAELLKRLSEQKLEQAAHLNETFRIATEHHSKATTEELKFQRQSKKFLQEMSPKLLDAEIEQEHHTGYKYYCASADKHLTW